MKSDKRTLIIVIGAIVLVLALAGFAVLLSGGDDSSSGVVDPDSTVPEVTYGDDVEQNRPVEVTGTALPALDDTLAVDPAIGLATPVIDGATFDGVPMSIGGATDGATMYVFLAHWCPHCNDEIPELIELDNRDGIPAGLDVVGISTAVDNTAANYPPSDWLLEEGWPWPAMADDAASTSFVVNGGGGFPYLMIVDADGTVLARASGAKSAEELAVWIQEALATSTT